MACLQDLSQARTRWSDAAADGFLTLFQTKLLLPAITDPARPRSTRPHPRRNRPRDAQPLHGYMPLPDTLDRPHHHHTQPDRRVHRHPPTPPPTRRDRRHPPGSFQGTTHRRLRLAARPHDPAPAHPHPDDRAPTSARGRRRRDRELRYPHPRRRRRRQPRRTPEPNVNEPPHTTIRTQAARPTAGAPRRLKHARAVSPSSPSSMRAKPRSFFASRRPAASPSPRATHPPPQTRPLRPLRTSTNSSPGSNRRRSRRARADRRAARVKGHTVRAAARPRPGGSRAS
jgi:hypothetical protein